MFVPDSHIDCTLENFDWRGKDKLRVIIDEFNSGERKKGLVFIGDPGVGKSHLMIGIFRHLIGLGKIIGCDVMYFEWSKFIQGTMDVMKWKGIPEQVVTSLNCDILLLDDIRPTWGRVWNDVLKKIVEKVYEENKIVIFSTNANSAESLSSVWSLEDYWMSRLFSVCDVIHIKGKDRRLV